MSAFSPGTTHLGWKIVTRISAGSAPRFKVEKGGQFGALQVFPFKGNVGVQHQELAERLRRWQGVTHPELAPVEVDLQDRAVLVVRPNLEQLPTPKHEVEKALQVLQVAARALVPFHKRGVPHGELSVTSLVTDGGRRLLLPPSLGPTSPSIRRLGLDADPRYAAPEVLDGRDPTPASDMFPLGLILYQLLTGKSPTDTAEPADALAARGAIPAPKLEGFSPAVQALYAKLTAIRPERRPQSAEELVADLEGVVSKGSAPQLNPLPVGEVRPVSIGGPLLVAVLLGGLLGGVLYYAENFLAPSSPVADYLFPPPAASPTPAGDR